MAHPGDHSLIISQSLVNHKLCWDSQLFLSFSAYTFSEKKSTFLTFLHGWLVTFLSLKPAKTEFLLVFQHAKIHILTLAIHAPCQYNDTPVSSARNLSVIFDSSLSFSDHISYNDFAHICDLHLFVIFLITPHPAPLPTFLIHSN